MPPRLLLINLGNQTFQRHPDNHNRRVRNITCGFTTSASGRQIVPQNDCIKKRILNQIRNANTQGGKIGNRGELLRRYQRLWCAIQPPGATSMRSRQVQPLNDTRFGQTSPDCGRI